MIRPPKRVARFLGYAGSLRPYSSSSLLNRALRDGVKLMSRLSGGRRVLRVRYDRLHFSGSAGVCPIVDVSTILERLQSLGVAIDSHVAGTEAIHPICYLRLAALFERK